MRMVLGQTGCQPMGNHLAASEDCRQIQKSSKQCANRQNDEGHGHDRWRFMRMIESLLVTRRAVKDHKNHPECVVSGHTGNKNTNQPNAVMASSQGTVKDFILTKKTGKRRTTSQSKRTNHHGEIGLWHLSFQTAHLPDVLLVMQGIDNGTSTKKE